MVRRHVTDHFHITSLFHKLLGFLLVCLVCSGALAAWLITRQMTRLVYTQTQVGFESDARNLISFLQQEQHRLHTAATDIAHDDSLLIAVELDVVEEVQNVTQDFQTLLEVQEVIVTNPEGEVISRGYDVQDRLGDRLLDNTFGIIETAGRYQLFAHAPLPKSEGQSLGHVVILADLSGNRAFFARLRASLGKDAILFAGAHEVGSTLPEPPGRLQPTPVASGLFTAFDQQFIGTERDLSVVLGPGEWRGVLLQSAAPLMLAIRRVQWGTVIFTLVFIGLIAGVIGLFFSAHIRKPMAVISQGIAAITQGDLETRLRLHRRDEWRLIEEALNSMTTNLSEHEAALQRKVGETTTLYEIGQDVAAQVDLDATLDLIAERAQALLGAEHAMLALRQAGSDTFLFQAQSGAVNEALMSVRLQPGQGLGGRVISTGMPVRVGDYPVDYADSPFLQLVLESGMRSWLGVPLRGQDQVIGVLYVTSSSPHLFDAEDQQLLSALGDQAAIAIEKTQLYEQIRAHAADLEGRVQERTAELTLARDQALEASLAKSEFLANMSHELRTPLNAILGFTQLMRRAPELAAEHREHLEVITRSGEHLLDLINDVLEMSKIEAGRYALHEDSLDLHDLLHGLEEMFRFRAESKGLRLRFERAPAVPPYIQTDASKLRQVLINLLSNAVKFTQEGKVTLRCDRDVPPRSGAASESEERVRLVFQVADTGPGIAPEEQVHLFEAFGQATSGRQAQEGTGLGLAISRTFVQLLGGELTVDSDVGRGSVFTFDLLVRLAEASAVPTRPSGRRVVGVEPGQPVYRLLVVEDRLENRRLLVKMLEPWGFEVREASNGQEGIAVWEQWDPHLIWMDMRMPVMDGYKATTHIKSTTKGQATVVVALTASVFEEQRTIVLSAGCDDFVRKPFQEQEIADVLCQHLGVRFLYDEPLPAASSQAEDRPHEGLTPESLAGLPAHWRVDLHEAAQRADMDTMLSLLTQIEADHAPLADTLEALIQDFRFEEIIAWTQPGKDV